MDRKTRVFFLIGLAVAILVAVGVSQFASSNPDGLEFVAEQEGFAGTADPAATADSPLADYGQNLGDGGGLSTAVAGLLGVVATLAVGYGVFWLARRGGNQPTQGGTQGSSRRYSDTNRSENGGRKGTQGGTQGSDGAETDKSRSENGA